jgi:hypothetical protein
LPSSTNRLPVFWHVVAQSRHDENRRSTVSLMSGSSELVIGRCEHARRAGRHRIAQPRRLREHRVGKVACGRDLGAQECRIAVAAIQLLCRDQRRASDLRAGADDAGELEERDPHRRVRRADRRRSARRSTARRRRAHPPRLSSARRWRRDHRPRRARCRRCASAQWQLATALIRGESCCSDLGLVLANHDNTGTWTQHRNCVGRANETSWLGATISAPR